VLLQSTRDTHCMPPARPYHSSSAPAAARWALQCFRLPSFIVLNLNALTSPISCIYFHFTASHLPGFSCLLDSRQTFKSFSIVCGPPMRQTFGVSWQCQCYATAKCTYWRWFARRGKRNACRFSVSCTRRAGLAIIYKLCLRASLCRR